MLFDTHCHLNFKAFDGRVEEVVDNAKKVGVNNIIVPGTDVESSRKAVEIAEKYQGVYAAVGIHPHHVYQYLKDSESKFLSHESLPSESEGSRKRKNFSSSSFEQDIIEIEKLLKNSKVVAVGEIGIDKHYYQKTKYKNYQVNPELVEGQKDLFTEQIKLAIKYKKALIIHNREAKKEVLKVLSEPTFAKALAGKAVFHCCEPDEELLEFAKKNKIYIGTDGDITYRKDKQEFIKEISLDMLVLETDSPFLAPDKKFPNEPKNIPLIAGFIAQLLHCPIDKLAKQTTENARRLFSINN